MPRTLEIATREAVSKRGVSVAVIPGDVALQEATPAALAVSEGMPPRPATIVPDAGSLTRLAALLNEADRVTILCGSGCEGAQYDLVGLGEHLYMVKAVLNAERPRR